MEYRGRAITRIIFGALVLASLLLVTLWNPAGAETQKESAARQQYSNGVGPTTVAKPPAPPDNHASQHRGPNSTPPGAASHQAAKEEAAAKSAGRHVRQTRVPGAAAHRQVIRLHSDQIAKLIIRQESYTAAGRTDSAPEPSAAPASRRDRARAKARQRRLEHRLAQLRAQARAGRFSAPPATSVAPQGFARQMQIARGQIAAYPVPKLPPREYLHLYKKAARKYGFGRDWYILAAVGEVESNHGQNMGPSSAGALGPMQFLPSTWRVYGIDGNHDRVANIMDPRDAIPAAARYLKLNGAPRHWYRALYAYNHASWYVKKVLAVAQRYRELSGIGANRR